MPCSVVLKEAHPQYAEHLHGDAVRVCLENGTWSQGFRTNYGECANSFLQHKQTLHESNSRLVELVQYMVFIGSLVSLISLVSAVTIFYLYRNFWSERITIHVHLMVALAFRSVVLFTMAEPFVMQRNSSYRDNDVLCKSVLVAHLLFTMTSVNWMLVQGVYLNRKLTTNVLIRKFSQEFRVYYFIGWGLPSILVALYVIIMVTNQHLEDCWQGYPDMIEIRILLYPTVFALVFNGLLLCNILRIVILKGRVPSERSEFGKVLSIAKATLVLCPILGLNNLLLLYNPGGDYETTYVAINAFFGSTQGFFVALVYCFNSVEVHQAIRRSYERYSTRRSMRSSNRENVRLGTCRVKRNSVPPIKENENAECANMLN